MVAAALAGLIFAAACSRLGSTAEAAARPDSRAAPSSTSSAGLAPAASAVAPNADGSVAASAASSDPRLAAAFAALEAAAREIGPEVAGAIRARIDAAPAAFLDDLDTLLSERGLDPDRFRRVDKVAEPLPADFVPGDLVSLKGIIPLAKAGLELRKGAAEALAAMAAAARSDGVALTAGSTYRSWQYQREVFDREVKTYGEAQARRESAEPGRSQHQLGTAIDFSPIDDVFEKSPAFAWLAAHARSYGFSRSYPDGMETVTGYRPESWHWRWLGEAACRLEGDYFGGVQQYLMEFLSAYSN